MAVLVIPGMALPGAYGIAPFQWAFWLASQRHLDRTRFLRTAVRGLPVRCVAGVLGWVVSEVGRGPWLVDGLLPVTAARTGIPALVVVEVGWLIVAALALAGGVVIGRLVRLGPDGMQLWPADSDVKRAW